jgi:hypothetical protein
MREASLNGPDAATSAAPTSESENGDHDGLATITLASEKNPHEWFYAAARRLLGKDAGYALHLLTGYPASSCYAYVAKDSLKRRRPPEHFLRTLFHSNEGEQFHAAFMAGCPWWRELQRDAALGRKVRELQK